MHLVPSICLLFLQIHCSASSSMTDNRNLGNYNDTQPYVVGILSPSTTLYIDQAPPDNGNAPVLPPSDLNLERRNTNSFQITSVTVQGSRKHDDLADDSCDDLDESHTDDLSSDLLDSSRADNEGYHSEDNLCDDLSPCGPIIFAQLPSAACGMVDRNMNLSIGVTPTFAAIGPVAGGVTMMTSKSESPISAQVPIMNPLPNNWQRRFKVVKIMSSEPFRRGRWLCMDFKDPPADVENESPKPEMNGTPPTIQITNFDSEEHREENFALENFAQVYEIPINQTFSGNFIMSSQQHMYGIILPQNEYVQPVTLVQDLSLQTTDRNFNNLVNHQSILVQADPYGGPTTNPLLYSQQQQPPVGHLVNNNNTIQNQSPPATVIADNNYISPSEAVLNQINASGNNGICDNTVVPPTLPRERSRNNSNSGRIQLPVQGMDKPIGDAEETESFAFLDNELSRTSGLLSRPAPSPVFGGMNGTCCVSPVLPPRISFRRPPPNPVAFPPPPPPIYVAAPPPPNVVAPPQPSPPPIVAEVKSAAPTGANTVAIDNKIEQAMDLVKSHLMFAVREEVEVLKEKITELLERISQLEHENDILRANASAETLKQLNNQSHKKTASGGTGKPSPIGPIPPPST